MKKILMILILFTLILSCSKKADSDSTGTEINGSWINECVTIGGNDQDISFSFDGDEFLMNAMLFTSNDGTCSDENRMANLVLSGTFSLLDKVTTPGESELGGGVEVTPIKLDITSFKMAAIPDMRGSWGCSDAVPDVGETPIEVGNGEDSPCEPGGVSEINGTNAYIIYTLADATLTLNTAQIEEGYPDECDFNAVNMPSSEDCVPYLLMPEYSAELHTLPLTKE